MLGEDQGRYDAVAEIWLDNESDLAGFRDEAVIETFIRPDELKFIDKSKSGVIPTSEEVLISGPVAGSHFDEADLWWSAQTRPQSVKLLVFVSDGADGASLSTVDAALGRRLGAFRQTVCRTLRSLHTQPGSLGKTRLLPFIGVHELWWPTVTRFRRAVEGDRAAWEQFRGLTEGSVTLLAQAERFI